MLRSSYALGQRGSSPRSPSTDLPHSSPHGGRAAHLQFTSHQGTSMTNNVTIMTAAGEAAASPIPLSSPTRRQTSLSPGAYKEVGGVGLRASPRRYSPRQGGGATGASLAGVAHDLDDEVKMVDMVFGTLTSSLAFYQTGKLVPGQGGDSEIATPVDAANFISHFTSILTCASAHSGLHDHQRGSEAALTRLIFENAYDVVGTLTSLVQCSHRNAFVPSRSTRVDSGTAAPVARTRAVPADDIQEAFSGLRLAAVESIKQLLTLSVEAAAASTSAVTAKSTSSHLFNLLHGALSRCGTLKHLLALVLLPTSPEVLRVASIEAIFIYAMRSPQQQSAVQSSGGGGTSTLMMQYYDPLLKAVVMDTSPLVRCYAAAVLRHLAGTFPRHAVVIKSVSVLLRCVAQESSLDTIALCAGAVECVVRRASDELDHSAVSIMTVVETVAAALEKSCNNFQCILKIRDVVGHNGAAHLATSPINQSAQEEEQQQQVHEFDVLEALCNLTRSCVLFTFSAVSSDIQNVFRHIMLRGVVPRLAKVASVSSIRTALAATSCLSLMVLRAPAFLNIPLLLSEPQTAATIVFGVVSRTQPLSAGRGETGGTATAVDDEALRSMTALYLLESAMMTATSFLSSPLSRAQWRSVLGELPASWEQTFEQRLTSALSSAALDMFADVVLMDECGIVLNDVNGVDWDDDMHPSAHSIRCLLDAQEIRRRGKTGSAATSMSHWRSVEQSRRSPDTRRGYLCFVLMGFAFITLTAPPLAPDALAVHRPAHTESHVASQNMHADDGVSNAHNGNEETLGTSHHHAKTKRGSTKTLSYPSQRFPHVSGAAAALGDASGNDQSANHGSARAEVDQMRSARHGTAAPDETDRRKQLLQKEFLEALKLTIHLSSHYQRKLLTSEEIAASAQMLRPSTSSREPLSRATSSSSMIKRALANPYAKPKVHNDRSLQLRAWSAAAVEEGDLFFFFIPLTALNVNVVDAVVAKARKHQLHAKKMFLMTPQSSRERRWFLLDMHSVIMPKLIVLLQVVKKMISVHTEEHVRMALQVLPSVHVVASSVGEKAITCANLLNVTDFIQQTFAIRMSSEGGAGANASFTGGGGSASFGAADQQGAVMASSFFAPLFPPAGREAGGADAVGPQDRGGPSLPNDVAAPNRALFDISSGDSEDASTDDDDEAELQFRVGTKGNERSQPIGNQHQSPYTIRRLSVRHQEVSQRHRLPQRMDAVVEERKEVGNDSDDDSSFELIR